MTSPYHPGELAVQRQAGVQAEALKLKNAINTIIQPAAQAFLQTQRLAIAATVDADGIWASLLIGKPGFLQALTQQLVQINAVQTSIALINKNLQQQPDIGILVIDFATRRRLRLNGKAQIQPNGSINVQTQQVYFNCPKYIQLRYLEAEQLAPASANVAEASSATAAMSTSKANSLNLNQQRWIAQADTFFIASFYAESGADASHRGGYPGFVKVINAKQIAFPDYAGNNMFNTLGNISLNPHIGLLFINFESGCTLQLTGTANIKWNATSSRNTDVERCVEFCVEQVIETVNATRLRWRFGEYSPFNPTRIIARQHN